MDQDRKKRAVAQAALEFVERGMVLGIGTGSTANHFIDGLARVRERVSAAVASSEASAIRLRSHGIRVVELSEFDRLPLYVDGADEATQDRMLIKGGGGALTREKIVAAASDRFVCIIDDSKQVDQLGAFPLPVEVIPMAVRQVAACIERLGGAPVERRGFLTDNGNKILDVHDMQISNPLEMEQALDAIVGVVCNGLFCHRSADVLLIGDETGVRKIGDGGSGNS